VGIEADLLIAQSAHEVQGSVSALGMGWQVRSPEPLPWAVVLILRSTRDLIDTEHTARVALETEDGSPVGTEFAELAEVEMDFTPDGITDEGFVSPVIQAFAFNLMPIPLEPNQEFRFRLWVDGETRDHWVAHFRTGDPS